MRNKTKRLLLGFALGSICSAIILIFVFYFVFYQPYNTTLKDYKIRLDSYRQPEMIKVYRFNKDLKAMTKISKNDVEIVELPASISSNALLEVSDEIFSQSLNSDIKAGTIAHKTMFYQMQDMARDLRVFELSGLILQNKLTVGDVVDIRINFPSGLDYVVLSKKNLIERLTSEENESERCIFYLNEDEILRLSSALVDAFLHEGTYLYTTKYISANNQQAAKVTYPANLAVQKLIENDPNIVEKSIIALAQQKRTALNSSLIVGADSAKKKEMNFAIEDETENNSVIISEVE